MKTPERIWIDEHGGHWSPVSGGTQQREYMPADLLTAAQAEIARLTAENAALADQAIKDRKAANATMSDALMWQFSAADGSYDGQPLLLRVWQQRQSAERRSVAAEARAERAEAERDAAMAKIARLTVELEDWKAAATRHHPNPADHRYWEGRYRDEKACADKAELDAARYRWLRTRNLDAISAGGVFAGKTPENVVLNGDDLDAAIDLAMVAGDAGADDRLQLSPRFQKIYDQACARDALDAEQGLHQRLGLATTEAEVARFKASMRQQRARVRRVAAAMVTRIRRDDYPDELGNTPPDTFAWGVRMAAEIIVGGRDTRAAHKLREEEANLQEARGKLHDLMCLPKDADLEIARQWAKEAYDLLS
ncbi:MAG: hypothetical protein A2092_15770 [Rhodobacteraceae bacterium GWE1_64_9]|nr:MAG: hypothetical protein A2092_15770 [Rhodobacteraceae bacterium GWE1_64_9]OHC50108.1 MAG: hypothetical protein A2X69_01830 [Rhodobacteraceae bacterium GWF1_65_7]HBD90228.1 hypothetical protein [Gemmobacter sp.]